MDDSIGVVVACHNEAEYLERTLKSLSSSLAGFPHRIIVVADRCTDDTAAIAARYCEVLLKDTKRWNNSYAENLELGFQSLSDMDFLSVVDADMLVPKSFFARAVAELKADKGAFSVSSVLYAEPSSNYNKVYHGYELTMERLRLTKRRRKHGHRVYRGVSIRDARKRYGSVFHDVLSPDSTLDRMLGARVLVMGDLVVWHLRKTGLRRSISSQVRQGRSAREMGVAPLSVAKEVFRARPVVPLSYLLC